MNFESYSQPKDDKNFPVKWPFGEGNFPLRGSAPGKDTGSNQLDSSTTVAPVFCC